MSRRNGKLRHADSLVPSKPDDISLAQAVEEKFLQLTQLWFRNRHAELGIPDALKQEMFLWRRMRVRHKQGDFRHSAAEMRAVRTVAEWTLKMKATLCNQDSKHVEWRD